MAATLGAIGKGATLNEVRTKLRANYNTVTSRLARLIQQGLVTRELGADGRTYIYQQK